MLPLPYPHQHRRSAEVLALAEVTRAVIRARAAKNWVAQSQPFTTKQESSGRPAKAKIQKKKFKKNSKKKISFTLRPSSSATIVLALGWLLLTEISCPYSMLLGFSCFSNFKVPTNLQNVSKTVRWDGTVCGSCPPGRCQGSQQVHRFRPGPTNGDCKSLINQYVHFRRY